MSQAISRKRGSWTRRTYLATVRRILKQPRQALFVQQNHRWLYRLGYHNRERWFSDEWYVWGWICVLWAAFGRENVTDIIGHPRRTRRMIVEELQSLNDRSLQPAELQGSKENPGLYYAARREFETFEIALSCAGKTRSNCYKHQPGVKDEVIPYLQELHGQGKVISRGSLEATDKGQRILNAIGHRYNWGNEFVGLAGAVKAAGLDPVALGVVNCRSFRKETDGATNQLDQREILGSDECRPSLPT